MTNPPLGGALHIVVWHPAVPDPPYRNEWEDERAATRLRSIITTAKLGRRLEAARAAEESVFVHRCAWTGGEARIVCAVKAVQVDVFGGAGAFARFEILREINAPPALRPRSGQIDYVAVPPS